MVQTDLLTKNRPTTARKNPVSHATAAAAVVRRWGFFDQQGELLCDTDLEELWRDVGPWLAITRVRLQEALLTGAAAVHIDWVSRSQR